MPHEAPAHPARRLADFARFIEQNTIYKTTEKFSSGIYDEPLCFVRIEGGREHFENR